MAKVAVLIDGGFYRKRATILFGMKNPNDRAKELINYCYKHISDKDELYRIFYYDCPPISKKVNHPITKKQIDFSKSPQHTWVNNFIACMLEQRKVALRLGRLSEETANYIIPSDTTKRLCDGTLQISDLKETDIIFNIKQKGVDMTIGIDIASLAYKKQVDRIVLIAGDSDFVPASKLARREGIDFVLDPLWNHINPDLFEHIDGLITKAPKLKNK